MKLDLRQLEARGQRSATIDAEVVRSWSTSLGLEPSDSAQLSVTYERRGAGLRIDGVIACSVEGHCAVCGGVVKEPLEVAVAATFVREGDLKVGADDLSDEDGLPGCLLDAEQMEEEVLVGDEVDLRPWLRDEWRLGVPLALRCPDEVCREAAASSQKETVDPRWAGLAALRDNLPGGE